MTRQDVFLEPDFARFYDWSYGDRSDDIEFYIDMANQHGQPVLDVACGTGRLALPLVEAGIRVTAMDISPAMLAILKRKLRGKAKAVRNRIALYRADMAGFELGRTFPCVFVPNASLFHLTEPIDIQLCLSCLFYHTRPGGLVVIDLASPRMMGSQKPGDESEVRRGKNPDTGRVTVEYNRKLEVDRESQTLLVEHVYVEGRARDAPRLSFQQRYRWFEKNEGIVLLQNAGFSDVRAYGDYEGTPYAYGADRLVLTATRRPMAGR